MRQVALENALDRGSRTPSPEPVTHVEEQRALRDETIAAFHTAVDSADDEDDLTEAGKVRSDFLNDNRYQPY